MEAVTLPDGRAVIIVDPAERQMLVGYLGRGPDPRHKNLAAQLGAAGPDIDPDHEHHLNNICPTPGCVEKARAVNVGLIASECALVNETLVIPLSVRGRLARAVVAALRTLGWSTDYETQLARSRIETQQAELDRLRTQQEQV